MLSQSRFLGTGKKIKFTKLTLLGLALLPFTVSLLILLAKLRGSDFYPGGTVSHRTRQPSLDAQWSL
jgi:hypothetical protein